MIKFIAPFRVGKKQSRAVLDSNGHEVVVFPKGCEYMASNYVGLLNGDLNGYSGSKTAGDIAAEFGIATGEIGCPHCGIVEIGAITTNKREFCGKDRFDLNTKKNDQRT